MSLLNVRNITKRFGSFVAVEGVSFSIRRGEVLALLGENGAGKSTLMKICYGMMSPDDGALEWDGQPIHLPDPATARRLGIGMVHQHFTLAPALTVSENLALAVPPRGFSPRDLRESAVQRMQRAGFRVDPDLKAGDLPVGQQQQVEILKALGESARLLILDEPTGVLAPAEVADLFTALRAMRDRDTAIILITHKLPEALDLADRVAVLRRGQLVLDVPRSEITEDDLARAMVGRSMDEPESKTSALIGEVVLKTSLLSSVDAQDGVVHAGEVVGIAGVEGNGQSELAETVVGLRHEAPIFLGSEEGLLDASHWTVQRRIAWGLAHIPEDRHATALALAGSVQENMFLAGDSLPRRGPWIDRNRMQSRSAELMRAYDVRASSTSQDAASLSGGNQQKLVVAREMSRSPRLLVAVNPTRGLDVAATAFVHDAIRSHRTSGGATLLISSEIDELLALSDRILVLYRGNVVGSLRPGGTEDRTILGRLMTGLERDHDAS